VKDTHVDVDVRDWTSYPVELPTEGYKVGRTIYVTWKLKADLYRFKQIETRWSQEAQLFKIAQRGTARTEYFKYFDALKKNNEVNGATDDYDDDLGFGPPPDPGTARPNIRYWFVNVKITLQAVRRADNFIVHSYTFSVTGFVQFIYQKGPSQAATILFNSYIAPANPQPAGTVAPGPINPAMALLSVM
jgi:hypothetical protein